MDKMRSGFYKQIDGATIHIRPYESGRIECCSEPPIIDAKRYLKEVLEKYGIPYEVSR